MPSPLAMWHDACGVVIAEGPAGTGFLIQSPDDAFFYLCTCKHVIAATDQARNAVHQIEIVVSRLINGQLERTTRSLPLQDAQGLPRWRQHQDPNVDVFVLRVLVAMLDGTNVQPVPAALLPSAEHLVQAEVEPGDHLLVRGYPGAKSQYPSVRPIYRSGVLGTPVLGHLRVRTDGGHIVIPAFWVDGMMVPGNSGSPVILRPERMRVDGANIAPYAAPPYLLGLIAGCDYAQIDEVPAAAANEQDPEGAEKKKVYAGLALGMNVDTIRDTLALFQV